MTPDVEAIVCTYLSQHAAVVAVCGNRVSDRTPRSTSLPWVRVTQIDGSPTAASTANHVHEVVLQLDCYGGDDRDQAHAQASLLARTCISALDALPFADTAGVISKVKSRGNRRLPDNDFTPARERFTFDATVTVHP